MYLGVAREEHDREDLLREATALIERVELRIAGREQSVFVGFRRDGSGSIYFGDDPVYQFNTRGQLRRAFVAGRLFKSQQGALIAITRLRTPAETQLVSEPLDSATTADFLATMQRDLAALAAALHNRHYTLTGQVPEHADVIGRIQRWLQALPQPPVIATTPRVG